MKIVDVCAFYTPMGGGVKTYVERKLAAGPATGTEIVILAPGKDHGVQHHGPNARIVTLPAPRFPLDAGRQSVCGITMPAIAIDGLAASAPLRVERFLKGEML